MNDHLKNSKKVMWQGSRDRDNSAVQTAAMGQILRSTERILVIIIIIIIIIVIKLLLLLFLHID